MFSFLGSLAFSFRLKVGRLVIVVRLDPEVDRKVEPKAAAEKQ
jgi:hypothetical protein